MRADRGIMPAGKLGSLAALVTAGALGLSLAFAWGAEAATTEIVVSPLLILSGSATGNVSGFSAHASVAVDDRIVSAGADGIVRLANSPLNSDGVLTVSFTDADGMPQTVTLDLRDSVTGLQLTAAEIADSLASTTQEVRATVVGATATITSGVTTVDGGTTTVVGGTTTVTGGTTTVVGGITTVVGGVTSVAGGTLPASTTTTGFTTTPGSSTTSGTTTTRSTTTGTTGGGSGSNPPPGESGTEPRPVGGFAAPGSVIAVQKVKTALVIRQVALSPGIPRAGRPFTARVLVTDTRGRRVRGALVAAWGARRGQLLPAHERATGPLGIAVLRLRPTKLAPQRLKLVVAARKPGERASARRVVPVRLARRR